MTKLNLDYEVHTLKDIFNDPDLDFMLRGIKQADNDNK